MLRILLCFFVLALGFANAEADFQKRVTTGVYVTSIYDINLEQNYFGVDYLMWFVYRKDQSKKFNLHPENTIKLLDIFDGQIEERIVKVDSSLKLDVYVLKKVSAKVRNDFDVKDFPFDKQVIRLRFEDIENDLNKVVFNINSNQYSKSGIDSQIKIDGIAIKSQFSISNEPYVYKNNFGNPRTNKVKDVFDRIVVTINVEREVGFLFLKLFTGLYVSFFIAMLSFFVNPKDISTRFSLPVGSLFAGVGNKYFVDGLLPRVNSMTLADSIHSIAFLFIFFIILFSVINIYVTRNDNLIEKNQKIKETDFKAFIIISILFSFINIFLIVKSMF